MLLQKLERRIEAFHMSNLQDGPTKCGQPLQCSSCLQAISQRFLDHHRDASLEKWTSYLIMEDRWDGDHNAIDQRAHFIGRGKPLSRMFSSNASPLLFA
jgi:hypothetical protein